MKIKISPEAKKLKDGLIKATNMTSEEKKKDFQNFSCSFCRFDIFARLGIFDAVIPGAA